MDKFNIMKEMSQCSFSHWVLVFPVLSEANFILLFEFHSLIDCQNLSGDCQEADLHIPKLDHETGQGGPQTDSRSTYDSWSPMLSL